jgi:hypothetical protein
VLHPWLEAELTAILATLPEPEVCSFAENRRWEGWQEGLSMGITLPESLPPLRMLLVLDNLIGHYRVDFVLWLFAHGIMPLYNALGGSWLHMAESIQRIPKRRDGQHPTRPEKIIAWLEGAARGWNREPTPFIWGGKRPARVGRWGSLRDLLIAVHLAGDHGLHVGLNPYLVQQVAKVLAIGPPSTTLSIVLVTRVAPNSASTRRNAS